MNGICVDEQTNNLNDVHVMNSKSSYSITGQGE